MTTSSKQTGLTVLLVVMTLVVAILTLIAFQREGAGLFQVFIGNIRAGGWNGQFNADFTCYLLLSGLWLMWRNHFRPAALLMGVAASILGIVVFAPYLVYLLYREKGNLVKVLVGNRCE
jgi:hypothetical protein